MWCLFKELPLGYVLKLDSKWLLSYMCGNHSVVKTFNCHYVQYLCWLLGARSPYHIREYFLASVYCDTVRNQLFRILFKWLLWSLGEQYVQICTSVRPILTVTYSIKWTLHPQDWAGEYKSVHERLNLHLATPDCTTHPLTPSMNGLVKAWVVGRSVMLNYVHTSQRKAL